MGGKLTGTSTATTDSKHLRAQPAGLNPSSCFKMFVTQREFGKRGKVPVGKHTYSWVSSPNPSKQPAGRFCMRLFSKLLQRKELWCQGIIFIMHLEPQIIVSSVIKKNIHVAVSVVWIHFLTAISELWVCWTHETAVLKHGFQWWFCLFSNTLSMSHSRTAVHRLGYMGHWQVLQLG